MGDLKTYKYNDLNDGEIRILHLQPGVDGDSVFISISHEKLDHKMMEDKKLKYRALSWQWGSKKADKYIRVKNRDNKGPDIFKLEVKSNLLNALKRLRKRDSEVRLWVDAICIKQSQENSEENTSEKSNQISMMTEIYSIAEEVCIWIGEARDSSEEAIDFINSLVKLDDINHIAALERKETDESIARKMLFLIKLLKRGWFSRRWVIQEIAVARHATLRCGSDCIEWTNVADAITLLEKFGRDGTIDRYLRSLPSKSNAARDITNISSLPAYRLVQNTTGMSRGATERGLKTWRYTLEELVSFLAAFKASRLHDTLYAIIGLSSDFEPESTAGGGPDRSGQSRKLRKFKIDYGEPALVVFKRFLNAAINEKESKSLDIICRPWAPKDGEDIGGKYRRDIELPSWIPSLHRKPFQSTLDGNMVRHNPDPLVGPAVLRHRFYTASGSEEMSFEIPEIENPESKCMIVKGFVLGKIGEIWGCGDFGNVPSQWLEAGGWTTEKEPPPEELWRTLVADRNEHGGDPDRWYPRVFQSTLQERGISYGFETYRLIHESTNATVPELFRRVQAVVWNRRLVRIQGEFVKWLAKGSKNSSSGALGLAPSEAQKGDLICIIFGCSVPLVLRDLLPSADGETNANPLPDTADSSNTLTSNSLGGDPKVDGGSYTLIGECYVDHMMDGEAISFQKNKNIKVRYFKFST